MPILWSAAVVHLSRSAHLYIIMAAISCLASNNSSLEVYDWLIWLTSKTTKHSFKRQLHTSHVVAVGCRLQNSSRHEFEVDTFFRTACATKTPKDNYKLQLKHTTPAPRYGQYLTHAHSHITQAVADSCFGLLRPHQHGIASTVKTSKCCAWIYASHCTCKL